jgi:hypothetical protein
MKAARRRRGVGLPHPVPVLTAASVVARVWCIKAGKEAEGHQQPRSTGGDMAGVTGRPASGAPDSEDQQQAEVLDI